MRRLSILTVLAALLIAVLVTSIKRDAAHFPSNGFVAGIVLDTDGKPADGVRVTVSDGTSSAHVVRDAASAITTKGGRFSVAANPDREWMITATHAGQTGTTRSTGHAPITLALHDAAIRVRGVVRSRDGRPISAALLRAYPSKTHGREPFFEAATDETGYYELSLDSETWFVEASARGFCDSQRPVSVASELDFELDPGARVEGRVVAAASGRPAPFATVLAVDMGARRRAWRDVSTAADREGRFVFDSLPEGQYRFQARAGGDVGWSRTSVIASAASPVHEALVSISPARRISGRVKDGDGAPVAGAVVDFWQEADSDGQGPVAITSAKGDFQLDGVLPWKLRITATPNTGSGLLRQEVDVDPTARNVTLLDIKVGHGATISGRVTDSTGAAAPFVWVGALKRRDKMEVVSASTRTDEHGKYALRGLFSETLVVEVHGGALGSARSAPLTVVCDWKLRGVHSETANLQLRRAPVVSGTVRDEAGAPVAAAAVFASRAEEKVGESSDRPVLATTTSAGRFELYGLPPGDFMIRATYGHLPILLARNAGPGGRRVEITDADVNTDLVLARASGSISGTVSSAGGPVADAFVRARSIERHNDDEHSARTSTDGRFTIDGLPSGEWEVSAVAPGFALFGRRSWSNVRAHTAAPPVALHLDLPSVITGTVVSETGSPETDFVIEQPFMYPRLLVHDPAGSFVLDSLNADATGHLTITTPSGLSGTLVVTKAMVAVGARSPAVTVRVEPGLTVTGMLLDARTGMPAQYDVYVSDAGPAARTRAKKDGTFKLVNLPRGRALRISVFATIGGGSSADSYLFHPDASAAHVDMGPLRPLPGPAGAEHEWATPGLYAMWDSSGGAAIVSAVESGKPAAVAGVQKGDRVVAIDGLRTAGIGNSGLSRLLAGKDGSSVIVEVSAKDSPSAPTRKLTLTREFPSDDDEDDDDE